MTLALLLVLASDPIGGPKNEIVPGERIGLARLGRPTLFLEDDLGRPTAEVVRKDRWMWQSWTSAGGKRLDVLSEATHTGDAVEDEIRVVRATSPSFVTKRALGSGASERAMRRSYPRARDIGTYRPPGGGAPIHVFDDVKGGIAFEVLRGKCVAVAVHRRGSPLAAATIGYRAFLAAPLSSR